jgi:heavy metal efflux system protein
VLLRRIIDFHLDHRWFVLVGLLGLIGMGLYSMSHIAIDAFPDLTNNQITVITECPSMAPVEVEQLVTFPIETALMGLPRSEGIRSVSKLGLSMVTLLLDDSMDTYFARQLVNERLQEVRSRIPEGLEPGLGPVATAFGEVYQYTLESGSYSAMELKTLHEWQIKNQLRTVPGVNEINTWGGLTREYHIEVDPVKLQRYGLVLRDIYNQVRDNNANFGGGYIEHASEQYTVRGLGRTTQMTDLEQIVLIARAGTPVLLRDVARVSIGAMPRQGAVTRDGQGETVSGMAIMLKGENGKTVIERVKAKLATLRLPDDVKIVPFYDQSTVIDGTIRTVRNNLLEGGALVIAVLFLFLGNVKAALIVASVIPLSMLVGFIGMRSFGVSANLMSLGAIDFGMIVDGAVVMMENAARRVERADGEAPLEPGDALERVRQAAHEVARPITFAVAIIIAVYMPIVFLEGLEGRMFRPMAITVCSALIGSLILALAVVPAAASIVLRRGIRVHKESWFARVRRLYEVMLELVFRYRRLTLIVSVLVLAVAVGSLFYIGTEFMPRLDEGSVLITTRKLPGISLTESIAITNRVEQVVRTFPEVTSVVTKLGRPDLATEAMGIYEGDVYVLLRPRQEWRYRSKEGLIQAMAEQLEAIPGVAYNFTQPMAMRLDEVVSGIKADVALKIYGEDPRTLEQLGERGPAAHEHRPGRGGYSGGDSLRCGGTAGGSEPASPGSLWDERLRRARCDGRGDRRQLRLRTDRGTAALCHRAADSRGVPARPAAYRGTDALGARRRTSPLEPAGASGGGSRTRGRVPGERSAPHRGAGQRPRPRPRELCRRCATRGGTAAGAASGLLHGLGRAVRESAARHAAAKHCAAALGADHLRVAVRHVRIGAAGAADHAERALRTGGRGRGAVASRVKPEPFGIHRLHRAVRSGGAERHRTGGVNQ